MFVGKAADFNGKVELKEDFNGKVKDFHEKNSKKTSTKNSKKIPGRMLGLLTLLRISKTTDYNG